MLTGRRELRIGEDEFALHWRPNVQWEETREGPKAFVEERGRCRRKVNGREKCLNEYTALARCFYFCLFTSRFYLFFVGGTACLFSDQKSNILCFNLTCKIFYKPKEEKTK
jgi:hypothetical protein